VIQRVGIIIKKMETDNEIIQGLPQMAEAIEKLAANPEAFNNAHSAYIENNAAKFEGALTQVGIAEHCHIICRFFCRKHCGAIHLKFCLEPNRGEVDAKEILAFANAVVPILKDEATVRRFLEIMETENVKAWNDLIKKLQLERFCYQLSILFCSLQCRKKCYGLCPPNPLITNVGNIPISQIDTIGFGSGPSVPVGYTGFPNPGAGYGDHPFGGSVLLKGIFNMATATEYLVEVSPTGAPGSYSPIIVGPQGGYDVDPIQPPPPVPPDPPYPGVGWNILTHQYFSRTRSQSTGVDPGWFKINQLFDSDGGRNTTGEKILMMWPTSAPDGVFYLRLRVRDGATTRVSSPQIVRLDNTGPFPLPRPTISLQLQKPDGTLELLKCGKVKKGSGLILITIHAYDPNMSSVSVTARGNSGLSVPVISTTAVPLSKTYNGNISDQGYVVPTQFLWDPWNDPNIVPCCYLIYVEINDRAILNNAYYGGHSSSGWEAIEIGL
jgi:hypothetical protein